MATRSLMRSRYLLNHRRARFAIGGPCPRPCDPLGRGVSRVLRRARRTRRVTLAGGEGGGCAETFCDRAQDLHRDLAVLVKHIPELGVSEDEAAHWRRGFHSCGARSVVDEGDLAEEIAGAKSPLTLGGVHLGAALQDDEEVSAALALLGQDPARRDVDLVGAGGDERELLVVAAAEERHRAQTFDTGICHGAEFSPR